MSSVEGKVELFCNIGSFNNLKITPHAFTAPGILLFTWWATLDGLTLESTFMAICDPQWVSVSYVHVHAPEEVS